MQIGARIGAYEIIAKLGEGGMGEVYRATDGNLKRSVAIKVLPAAVAGDADRLARFQREAEVLAALNHPHIAAIYGLEKTPDFTALVMELVDGEDLSQRIGRGPIPIDDALPIAKQIAEALEAAHEQGIIHRDLKPANIKVRPDGTVKVLDFGLAKALDANASGAKADAMISPTLSLHATQMGMILGTAAYMAPEQASGKTVDKRADIWSFAVVLMEMITGRRLFEGETVSHTLADVLRGPIDFSVLPAETPSAIRDLLRRCLNRDVKKRTRDIGDARLAIDDALNALSSADAGSPMPAVQSPIPLRGATLPWTVTAVAVVALVGLAAVSWTGGANRGAALPPAEASLHAVLPISSSQPFSRLAARASSPTLAIAVAPNGSRVAYVADLQGTSQVVVRGFADTDATPLAGTEGAEGVFFSPDSQWIGFSSGGKLKKVALGGGAPTVLAAVPNLRGVSWADDGTIVFSPDAYSGLWRVSASGGSPQPLTELDAARGERNHRWPDMLPGSRAVLFAIGTGGVFNDARIVVQSLDTGGRTTIVEGGTNPRYIPTGHVVYSRDGSLTALPFDLDRLQPTGPPVTVLSDVLTESSGVAQFSFSASGTLLAVPGRGRAEGHGTPVWVDRRGRVTPTTLKSGQYTTARLSPDGTRMVTIRNDGPDAGVWVFDLVRGTGMRLETPSRTLGAAWFGDSDRVIYSSERSDGWTLAMQRATYGQKEAGVSAIRGTGATASADGQQIAYSDGSILNIHSLSDGTTRAVDGPFATPDGASRAFSPDGRFLAVTSSGGGRDQVWVLAVRGTERWQISADGGAMPRWHPNGRELFYWRGNQLLSVPVTTAAVFSAGTGTVLFEGRFDASAYDVSPDGTRFMILQLPDAGDLAFTVVTNWFAEVARLASGPAPPAARP